MIEPKFSPDEFKASMEEVLGESVVLSDAELRIYWENAVYRACLMYRRNQIPIVW
jgi:hypothetical protein